MSFDLNAAISAAGAVVTALASIFASVYVSRKTIQSQSQITAQTIFSAARKDAYWEFEKAFELWENNRDAESFAALARAENALRLVASEETVTSVGKLVQMVKDWDGFSVSRNALEQAHAAALHAMRRDLFTYPAITSEEEIDRTGKKNLRKDENA